MEHEKATLPALISLPTADGPKSRSRRPSISRHSPMDGIRQRKPKSKMDSASARVNVSTDLTAEVFSYPSLALPPSGWSFIGHVGSPKLGSELSSSRVMFFAPREGAESGPSVEQDGVFGDVSTKRKRVRPKAVELEEVCFTDVVDLDEDEAYGVYVSEGLTGRLVESAQFRAFILLCIVLNTALIGLQTEEAIRKRFTGLLSMLDSLFLVIFVIEILLKWYYGFLQFWKIGWNQFDFVIVLISLVGPSVTFLSSARVLRTLRVLRAFRSLRSISALQGLQIIVHTVIKSLPDMVNIIMLLAIVMYIFAVLGVTLFGTVVPEHFGSLGEAFWTLMAGVTQDGYYKIFIRLEEEGKYMAGALYFTIFIIFGAFVFANVLGGLAVTNLLQANEALKAAKLRKGRQLEVKKGQGGEAPLRAIVGIEAVEPQTWMGQVGLEVPDFDNITPEILEGYCLLLEAMEVNCAQYAQLRTELEEILEEVQGVNAHESRVTDVTEIVTRGDLPIPRMDEEEEEMERPVDGLSRLISRSSNARSARNLEAQRLRQARARQFEQAGKRAEKDLKRERAQAWAKGWGTASTGRLVTTQEVEKKEGSTTATPTWSPSQWVDQGAGVGGKQE